MKRIFTYMTLVAILELAGTFIIRAADIDLKTEADQTIVKFKQADPGLTSLFNSSAGYAVFPGVGKGGLIIGGAHGKGLVYQNNRPIGEATLTEASIGAQVGGVSFDEIIFFETPAALQEFKNGNYSLDAQVSGVVASEGAEQRARYQHGTAVFVLPRTGLMGQATVGGQKFNFTPLAGQQP